MATPSNPNPGYPNPAYPTPTYNMPTQASMAPPATVKGAFLTYVITAVMSLISIILVMTSDIWDEAIAEAGVKTPGINVDALVSTAKTLSVVVGVAFLALYLFFAFKMRAGRNWARIVLTVLSAFSIVSAFSATASVTVNNQVYISSTSQIIGYIGVALAVVAIVLMYLGSSNQYFSAMKVRR